MAVFIKENIAYFRNYNLIRNIRKFVLFYYSIFITISALVLIMSYTIDDRNIMRYLYNVWIISHYFMLSIYSAKKACSTMLFEINGRSLNAVYMTKISGLL